MLSVSLIQKVSLFQNYGGNNGVFGLLKTELKAPAAAHAKVAAQGLDNMVGVGLTMEGIDTNCTHGRMHECQTHRVACC